MCDLIGINFAPTYLPLVIEKMKYICFFLYDASLSYYIYKNNKLKKCKVKKFERDSSD